jgi:ABC-type Zn uptake system ZnuABC Zn-binding protein ZnuA
MRLPFPSIAAALLIPFAAARDEKVQILTTLPDLRVIAAEVGGPHVEAKSLLIGPEDPHFIDARPSFIKLANKADLYIKNGMSLEIGYEPRILTESRNPKIQNGALGFLDVSAVIRKLEVPAGVVDRAQGDLHHEGNPHYLLDPFNGKAVAVSIRDALTRIDPAHKTDFDERCAAFCRSIDVAMFGDKLPAKYSADLLFDLTSQGKLLAFVKERNLADALGGWAAKMAPFAGQPVVTYHQNLTYFQFRFNLERVAMLEPKPGIQPTSEHMETVVKIMKARNVRGVFYNVFQPKKPVDKVCAETGAKPVLFPHQVNAIEGTEDYVKMIDKLVNLSAAALGS